MPMSRFSLPLITNLSLAVPATGILIASYLYHRPLTLPKNSSISAIYEPSKSFSLFPRSLEIVNPKNHHANFDTRSITLLKSDISKGANEKNKTLNDEEILARFVKGFFGGWSFTPERGLLALLRSIGRKFIEAKFAEVPKTQNEIHSVDGLSDTKLPPRGTILFGGNFVVLDVHICSCASPTPVTPSLEAPLDSVSKTSTSTEGSGVSYIDIGFGSNERNFSGVHRFEVTKSLVSDGEKDKEVTITFSSMSCNPSSNKPPFPRVIFWFHCWYAMCLFRDGVGAVIRG